MERLTKRIDEDTEPYISCEVCKKKPMSECWSQENCTQTAVDRLSSIEDILGDDYDLDRLRELVEADREGQCVVLPFPLHSVLLDMSDPCSPDVIKDFRISATWTHRGTVFYCPWNLFNHNVQKGYIRLMSKSAEAALKGEQNDVQGI